MEMLNTANQLKSMKLIIIIIFITQQVNFYRFSISWPRVLPDGTLGSLNQAGVDYYNTLIDELIKAGIKPMVTIYHWDLPLALQAQGGWLSTSTVHHFEQYARLLFKTYGDRVSNRLLTCIAHAQLFLKIV